LKEAKGMVQIAARKLGCCANTIYNRAKESEELAECLQDERRFVSDIVEMVLYKAILDGEPWAVMFHLRTQARDRGYGDKLYVKAEGVRLELIEELSMCLRSNPMKRVMQRRIRLHSVQTTFHWSNANYTCFAVAAGVARIDGCPGYLPGPYMCAVFEGLMLAKALWSAGVRDSTKMHMAAEPVTDRAWVAGLAHRKDPSSSHNRRVHPAKPTTAKVPRRLE